MRSALFLLIVLVALPAQAGAQAASDGISSVEARPERPTADQDITVTAETAGREVLDLTYQLGFGTPVTVAMERTQPSTFAAVIPAQPPGTLVRYRIDDPNSSASVPEGTDAVDQLGLVVQTGPPALTARAPVLEWFIDPSDFSNMRRNHVLDDREFDAVLALDGVVWDGVRVRITGDEDMRRQFAKKSFHFTMPAGQFFEADGFLDYPVSEFVLDGEAADHTFGRAHSSWELYEAAGFPKVHSFGVRVEQNGSFFGAYRFQQLLNTTWLANANLATGSLYEAQGGFTQTNGFAKVHPTVGDEGAVGAIRPWLAQASSAAKTEFFRENWDIPNAVNYFAVTSMIGHDDSTTRHHYLRQDLGGTERWSLYPWDLDVTFGLDVADGGCAGTPMVDLLCTGDPLVQAFHELPGFETMLRRRQAQLLAGPFTPSRIETSHVAEVYRLGRGTLDLEAEVWRNNWPDFADRFEQFNGQVGLRRRSIGQAPGLPSPQPSAPTVVISEINFDPSDAGSEFVELYNPSSSVAIDLSGWTLDGTGLTFPGGAVLLPDTRLLAVGDDRAFRAGVEGVDSLVIEYPGSLADNGELIELSTDAGVVIDTVRYGATAPWPTAPGAGTATLSLLDHTLDNSLASSWGVSATAAGTPGIDNDATPTTPGSGSGSGEGSGSDSGGSDSGSGGTGTDSGTDGSGSGTDTGGTGSGTGTEGSGTETGGSDTGGTSGSGSGTGSGSEGTGENGTSSDGVLKVFAQGDTGTENVTVSVDGIQIGSFTATTTMDTYTFTTPLPANATVRVAFTNDGPNRNLTIDAIEANNTRYETEAPTTYSEGVWTPNNGCAPGYKQSQRLACNGHLDYTLTD